MKRGIFFTIASLFLAGLLITLASVFIQYELMDDMHATAARVSSMEVFMDGLEEDLERAVYIAGFRGLVSINNFISSNGTYLNDASKEFEQIIINGTIKDNQEAELLMEDQTLLNWSKRAADIGKRLDLYTNITFLSASISQSDPWNIHIKASFNISLVDNMNTAKLRRTITVSSLIPIENFEDPIYLIQTSGRIPRKIVRSNITDWNTNNLKEHLENAAYIAYNQSPSYIMRLEGNLGASPYGIETLVDKNEFAAFGISIYNATNVDYLYWLRTSANNSRISGITDDGHPYFQLDDEHVTIFNVTGDTY